MKYLTGKFRSIALIIVAILFSTTASSQNIDTTDIIQSSGFSIETLFRGIIGMAFLIFVSFLLSNNKKAINWKATSFGLGIQLILAISVLKISWVQAIFEFA
ncbi:MAG TPA: Na+ dependent nucleoside transporter N-terminal domain-containing protein, partial [Flavobacteriaceae bacterium]|nr:Na+ dependent nucleoside transporter N-terminal domain-containing protein [Flavobacteriaceae bacterium]